MGVLESGNNYGIASFSACSFVSQSLICFWRLGRLRHFRRVWLEKG